MFLYKVRIKKIKKKFMPNNDTLVVIPAYNEVKNLEKVILGLSEYFSNILLVDDGSDDSYDEILKAVNIKYVKHLINLGQGAALHTGLTYFLSQLNFEYVVTFDGDGQNRVLDASKMVNLIKKNKLSAVLGSRFIKNNYSSKIPFLKKIILQLAKLYESIFFKIQLTDAHNGLRVLRRDVVENFIIPIQNNDMSHATEISYKICKSKCKFCEYPVLVEYENKRSQNPINAINIVFSNLFRRL